MNIKAACLIDMNQELACSPRLLQTAMCYAYSFLHHTGSENSPCHKIQKEGLQTKVSIETEAVEQH